MSAWTIEPPSGFRTLGERPSGTRLVFVRHGEATCNVEGRVGGPRGCRGLTSRGRAEVAALADRLERTRELDDVVALYTSILPRAIETAALLARGLAPGLVVTKDCDLCELHPGDADGMTWEELVTRYGGPDWDHDPAQPIAPGGESWLDFYERCVATFARLAATHPGERVLLVVHGGVIEQAIKVVSEFDAARRLGLRTEHASLTEVEHRDGSFRLLRYNDRAPLIEA